MPMHKTTYDRSAYKVNSIAEYLKQKYIKGHKFDSNLAYNEGLSDYSNVSCTSAAADDEDLVVSAHSVCSGSILRHGPDRNSGTDIPAAIRHRLIQPLGAMQGLQGLRHRLRFPPAGRPILKIPRLLQPLIPVFSSTARSPRPARRRTHRSRSSTVPVP